MSDDEIRVGDRVRTGVSVMGRWQPMALGVVVSMSIDRSTAEVDVMSLHGGAPWVRVEAVSQLQKEPSP